MSSTFKRRLPSSNVERNTSATTSATVTSLSIAGSSVSFLPGTRPWTSGITLTSTGLRELDNILTGAGQPLGTCIWLEEDRWTNNLALCLVKYWSAEALCQGQELFFPVGDQNNDDDVLVSSSWTNITYAGTKDNAQRTSSASVRELLQSLPRNLNKDKQQQQEKQKESNTQQKTLLDVLEEDDEDEQGNAGDNEGLENAWQYSKAVQQKRLGLSVLDSNSYKKGLSNEGVFCHSYDLSGCLNDQVDVMKISRIVPVPSVDSDERLSERQKGYQYFRNLVRELESILSAKPHSVIRILFYRPKNIPSLTIALPLVLAYIRSCKYPVVILVTVQPWTLTSSTVPLQRCSDVVLKTEGFASRCEYPPPAEFRMLHGLLHILKISTITASLGHFADFTSAKRPAAFLYGLKRDRRKLNIELLHIPPEDYAAAGGSVGKGGVRSGAGKRQTQSSGLGCASSGGSGNSIIDF